MTLTVLPVTVLFLLCLLIFKKITVNVKKSDAWRVEIQLTLCAARISRSIPTRTSRESDSTDSPPHRRRYGAMISLAIDLLTYAEVEIRELSLPLATDMSAQRSATAPWRYHGALLALTSLLRSRARRLTIRDNAITLIPDGEKVNIDITLKIRLFHILRALIAFVFEEKLMKRRKKYVGK